VHTKSSSQIISRLRWSSVFPGPCRERLDHRPLAAALGFRECLFRLGLCIEPTQPEADPPTCAVDVKHEISLRLVEWALGPFGVFCAPYQLHPCRPYEFVRPPHRAVVREEAAKPYQMTSRPYGRSGPRHASRPQAGRGMLSAIRDCRDGGANANRGRWFRCFTADQSLVLHVTPTWCVVR